MRLRADQGAGMGRCSREMASWLAGNTQADRRRVVRQAQDRVSGGD
jgi:hypothetical protein